ncbi:MAG: hypothetical protein D6824_00530 [Planctomycetota bacterium]|nr:MAG: hypothetical protein D6824_00530 [Planctomycetota bacterium]
MTAPSLTKTVGVVSGLAAFAVALITGLAVDNPSDVILSRALGSLFVCYLIGIGVGAALDRLAHEALQSHQQANPAPNAAPSAPEETKQENVGDSSTARSNAA